MKIRIKIWWLLLAAAALFFLYLLIPLPGEKPEFDYSQVIYARDTTFLRVFLNEDEQWCLPPDLQQEIPSNLKSATLQFEDRYFFQHPGVNPVALARALYLNIKFGEIRSGGSTITMQLARMIGNRPRTLLNKCREMLLALKLELHHSKDEILQLYLNHAPYGTNVRGYIAASYRYFGKSPDMLTWAEASTLAILPNAPGLIFPSSNDQKLIYKRNKLLEKLHKDGIIDVQTYELSLLEPAPDHIIPFPLAAPHLTERMHATDGRDIIFTTIDQNIQYEVNFQLQQHGLRMSQLGIYNACALVVDNYSGYVLGYVGSQDFFDSDHRGMVDGVTAARSSGSILKPYLYALSIDDGIVLPQTLIKDIPTYYESFSPNNANEKFLGVLPAAEALTRSLNVPAVRLLRSFGVSRFYHALQAGGISTLFRDEDDYGLPLILGGAEVTAWDMAGLMRALANQGQYTPIMTEPRPSPEPKRLVSSGASYLIMEALKELERPGLEFFWEKYGNQHPIAWKTGTSYGHKDAWAVGSTPQYTIVVWVGNFDGTSNKSLSGMHSAGPLLFSILNNLPSEREWFSRPDDLSQVKICKHSGFYATENCTETEYADAPKKMRPLGVCPYHSSYFVNSGSEYAVCSHCWDQGHQCVKALHFPPDVAYFLRKNGTMVSSPPVHNPECRKKSETQTLTILYPPQNASLFLPRDFDGSYEPLLCKFATQFPEREVFWYLDDAFAGSTHDMETFPVEVSEGNHKLTLVDEAGNRDQVSFSVVRN